MSFLPSASSGMCGSMLTIFLQFAERRRNKIRLHGGRIAHLRVVGVVDELHCVCHGVKAAAEIRAGLRQASTCGRLT